MIFETYKGIEYVRISALPVEEQALIYKTLDPVRIIKILRDKELLSDCVQVHDYSKWKGEPRLVQPETSPAVPLLKELKLEFR
jgi:hypothetical protein